MSKVESPLLKVTMKRADVLVERAIKVLLPCFLHGQPGVGKSELIHQIGGRLRRPIIDIRLALYDPSDLKGIPYFDSNRSEMLWSVPSELPRSGRKVESIVAEFLDNVMSKRRDELDEEHAILFLDELSNAPMSVQAAAYQLVLDRKIGTYKLPSNVAIVAAGNRMTDRGAAHKMAAPLANRFAQHLEIDAIFADWVSWAINNGIRADVIGFLSHATQYWNTFEKNKDAYAFATPRMWTMVSKMLEDNDDIDMVRELVGAAVGEGIGIPFAQYREHLVKIPDIRQIFEGRPISMKNVNISIRYTLIYNIGFRLREILAEHGAASEEYKRSMNNTLKFLTEEVEPEMMILASRAYTQEFKLTINAKVMNNFGPWWAKVAPYVRNSPTVSQ